MIMVLDMEQIILHSVEYLNNNYKGCRYIGGFYEHDMASALWLNANKKV